MELRSLCDAGVRMDQILARHAAVGLAIGIVRDGRLQHFRARGVADIGSGAVVGEDTVFRIASMTKTFTAVAVMQLVERGLVDLDAPAETFLRAYRLVPAGPESLPPTVRHLLTHTAGVPEIVHPTGLVRRLFGETVQIGAPVPRLSDYYGEALRTFAEPGTSFAYSDHNFTTLGQIVADVSRQDLADYLREHIFAPLGMTSTDLTRTELVRSRLATGYVLGRRGPRPVEDYDLITAAAGGAYSTPADIARYVAALLGGGANEHGRMLAEATLATMFQCHYRPDPRLPGIGLSFWRGESGGHRFVDHGGILPGFNSEMFLAPDDGVGVIAFTNGASRAMFWLPGEVAGLLTWLIDVGDPPNAATHEGAAAPQRPEVWGELCGWYALRARFTDLRAREMTGLGVEVFVRRGQLMLRILTPVPVMYRGFPLMPDPTDPYAFSLDLSRFDIGMSRVVFSRESGIGVTGIHFDLLPMSADKRPELTNPRRWAQVGAVLAGVLLVRSTGRRLAGGSYRTS